MMKFDRKKKIFLSTSLSLLVLIGYLTFAPSSQKRGISSVENGDPNIEEGSLPGSLDTVSLSWRETEEGLILEINDDEGELCDKWTSLGVVFRAEGLAYSGEVDRVLQTSPCEEGRFQQTWASNLTQVQSRDIIKTGYFSEEPPQWVVEQIIFKGPEGNQILSHQDIMELYGSAPTMIPK